MNTFFDDPESFSRDLQRNADSSSRCWSCSCRHKLLVGFNAVKDLGTLDIPTNGCQRKVHLCPGCAVAYMNSFNATHSRKRGISPWTVEMYLKEYLGQ
jgi:hypothetical protein